MPAQPATALQCTADPLSAQSLSASRICSALCPPFSPSFPAACLLSLPLHCMQAPEPAEPLCEQDLHCATPTLLSISSCSMPAQPATALQCSADPLSAQAGMPGDQERAFAAVAAANRRGGGSESVLDALEAAESQSQAAPAQGGQDASTASAQGQQGGISPGVMHAVRADACQPPPPACSGVQFPLAAPPPPDGTAAGSHTMCGRIMFWIREPGWLGNDLICCAALGWQPGALYSHFQEDLFVPLLEAYADGTCPAVG